MIFRDSVKTVFTVQPAMTPAGTRSSVPHGSERSDGRTGALSKETPIPMLSDPLIGCRESSVTSRNTIH